MGIESIGADGMKILVACEESQAVTIELRRLGHEAYSCDIIPCSGGHPEWHIRKDVTALLNGNTEFFTDDYVIHSIFGKWDMIIAFPPCTYLTNVATRSHSISCTPLEKINVRTGKRFEAANFFMQFANANCNLIAIENPVGIMNTCYRKPDQVISPYMFAESDKDAANYVTKATCLWLKGLPSLKTNDLPKPNNRELFGTLPNGKAKTWEDSLCRVGGASLIRSKTFSGIARAMAEQWGGKV
jgi:hypothetical protein